MNENFKYLPNDKTTKKSIPFQINFLAFFLIIFGILIFAGYFLINLSNEENNLNLNNIRSNIPTLIPITLLPTQGKSETISFERKKIIQDVTSNAKLYLDYLQKKEVENLYLLLTKDSQKLYTREDLKKILERSEVKITSFNLKESIVIANQPSITGENAKENIVVEKIDIPENGFLEAILPLTINYVTKKGENKSINSKLYAKYQNNLWQFEYFGPPNF